MRVVARSVSFAPEVLLLGVVTLAIFGTWSASDGGYAEVVWYPCALLLLVLFAVLEWTAPVVWSDRWLAGAVAAFGGLTAWSFLSIVWAGDRGLALTGSNRTLLFLITLALTARRAWPETTAVVWAALWSFVVVMVGIVELVHAIGHGSGFVAGRFSAPIDYANANGALFALAAWPPALIARSRAYPLAARGLALGLAGAAAELALLAQSKGAALGTAATILVLLVVVPNRVRTVVPLVLVAAVLGIFHAPLLHLYTRLQGSGSTAGPVRSALLAIALSAACLVALGAVAAWLDHRLEEAPRRQARLRRFAAVVLLVALGSGIAAGIGRFGSPISVAKRTWHTFTHPAQRSAASSHFITGAGNNRYDFWRVAAHQFTSAPVLGAGVDNFGADYVQRRRSTEEPLYPHSLEAELLGGLGVIGFLLFATFAFAAARRCIAAARAQPERAVPGMTALALFSYWLAHGSVDWLWEFPALTGPVLAAVASCRLPPTLAAPEEEARVRAPSLARWLVIVPAVVFASLALIPAWLGARDVSLAAAGWRTDLGLAYQRLSNAASLNKLSDQPYVVAGTIAERRRDWSSSQRYFMRALGRNKDDWYAYFELGIAHAKLGDRTAALAALAHAHRLDPREPLISEVSSAVARRQTFSVAALDSDFVERDKRIATR